MQRRQFIVAGGALVPAFASSQATPDTAKILVGFGAGGLSDILARKVAETLRGSYAGNIIVENKPGVSGQLAISQLKDSPPDGSVMLLTHSSSLAMYPFTFKKLPYDPARDLLPVSLVCHTAHALCVGPSVPASVKNVKDFLAWTKEKPMAANYGTPGLGSMPHLIMTVVNQIGKADLKPITYRGTAASITDMLGGQISAASGPIGNFLPYVEGGKARLLATSGDSRSSFAPSVPTYREQGFALTAREWYALYLPRKTSPAIQRRAAALAQAGMSDPKVVASLRQSGVEPQTSTPDVLAAMLAADTQEWKKLTQQVGFTAES